MSYHLQSRREIKMIRRNLGSVAAVAICFLFALCSGAWTGIEPSPWKPQMNKLKAVENQLESVNTRLQDVLSTPPRRIASAPEAILLTYA